MGWHARAGPREAREEGARWQLGVSLGKGKKVEETRRKEKEGEERRREEKEGEKRIRKEKEDDGKSGKWEKGERSNT